MDEVDVDPVDLGHELVEPIQRGLPGAPVVLVGPVLADVSQVGEGDALRPVVDEFGVGQRVACRRRRRSSGTSIVNGRIASLMERP